VSDALEVRHGQGPRSKREPFRAARGFLRDARPEEPNPSERISGIARILRGSSPRSWKHPLCGMSAKSPIQCGVGSPLPDEAIATDYAELTTGGGGPSGGPAG